MDDKDLKKIAKELQKQGFVVEVVGHRLFIFDEDGNVIATIWASGDPRARANAIAILRRLGFKWPPPR